MKIQACNDEFIRAYWSKGEYSFAHESNFRHATPEEIAAGHRIDHIVDVNEMVDCEILDHPEDYTSPNCKKLDHLPKMHSHLTSETLKNDDEQVK